MKSIITTITNLSFFIIVLIMVSLSCESSNAIEHGNLQDEKTIYSFPVVIDTFQFDLMYKEIEDFIKSNYRPIYIGTDSDSLFVDYNIQNYYLSPPTVRELGVEASESSELSEKYWDKYQIYYHEFPYKQYAYWDSADIEIFIDTSQLVANLGYKKNYLEEKQYYAYPIFIKNKDTSSLVIGYGSHIPMVVEVKTEENQWFPLESQYLYRCGTGLPRIVLPKENIIISSIPITVGDKSVKFRLKLGNSYSNIINGRLN